VFVPGSGSGPRPRDAGWSSQCPHVRALLGDARDVAPRARAALRARGRADRARLVVTSPPYLRVVKYGYYNWLRTWFLGFDARAIDATLDDAHHREPYLLFMRDAFLLRPYHSPYFKSYPEDAKEKGERGLYFWAIARESYIGFAYNTKLLAKEAVPKNYEGLLHPAMKARMGVSVSDPAYKVIGAMVRTKGKEFVQKLKVQEIALHTIIPPALLDLIASGEVLASPAIFRNHTLNAIAKGAPVNWVPMDIVPTNVGGAAIAVQPPHPHAALLLADYLLGPEGQSVLEKYEYGSATKNLGFKRWRPDHGIVTEKYEKELEGWEKLLKQISRKGG